MDPWELWPLKRTDSHTSLVSTRSDTSYNRNRNRGYNRGANHGNRGANHGYRGANHGNRGANHGNRGANYGNIAGNHGNIGSNHNNSDGNHSNSSGNLSNSSGNLSNTRGGKTGKRGSILGNRGSILGNRGSSLGNNRGGNHGNRGGCHGNNRGGSHENRGASNGNSHRGNNHGIMDGASTSTCNLNDRKWKERRGSAHNRGNNLNDIHILARGPEFGSLCVPEDDTRSETGCNATENQELASNNGRDKRKKAFALGFPKLEEFSKMDSEELILIISNERSGWKSLLQTKLSEDKLVLIIRIVNKICEFALPQIKSKILLQICDTVFVEQLSRYLSKLLLHNARDKRSNKYFWDSSNQFFNDLIIVFDNIMQLVPKTAGEILPKLLTQACITVGHIGSLHRDTVVEESVKNKLEDLQVKLALCVEKAEQKKKKSVNNQAVDSDDETEGELEEPPDDFRLISVRPTSWEITNKEPVFIRSNIVKGRYKSVDHYLDVHFRLLREDFVAPLRTAICEYKLQNETSQQHGVRTRNFNVRFYYNVEVIYSMLQHDKVAYVVQLTNKNKKEKLKLDNSRRLMFGSLLCFTNDCFKTMTFATIANRDTDLLNNGKIGIEFLTQRIEFNKKYTMLECAVYFEPYYQVLRALQSITEETFPLKKYIIDVDAVVEPPEYYQYDSRIHYSEAIFYPLIPHTWPSERRLNMDESQLRAFQSAVTRKFCVIQGPPGTGKTYIGLKIAELLLLNHELWNHSNHPILVICYTNHALDQFLEGILAFTKDIIRVGGQSKSQLLKTFNIRDQRKIHQRSSRADFSYRNQRRAVESYLSIIKRNQGIIVRAQNFDSILDFSLFLQSNPSLGNTWFGQASSIEQKKWLMGGRTKRQRNAETQDMELKQLLTQLKIGEASEAADNNDSDEEFYECESDNRKLDDGAEDFYEDEVVVADIAYFSSLDFKRSIQNLEHELAEIEEEGINDYEGLILFDVRQAKLDELEKVIEDYEYFQFRMEQQRNIILTVQLPNVDFAKPFNISIDDRWQMYAFWLKNYLIDLQNTLNEVIRKYQHEYKVLDELKQLEDVRVMRDRKVIGMTTTGAARFQPMLKMLKCPIVIVEEAAEVLESHVVVALTDACQHLILIGDHQQLRPSTVEYKLVKEHKFDISLFERMVKNGIHCERLEVQHRMRPEISRLIVPAIYPTLIDHDDVKHYPNVLGVTQNLFFISHTEFETEVEQTSSKMNLHEANFIIRLARYLLLQGYKPGDVTIITPYSGQKMFLLKERRKYSILTDIRITDVDDYQGEESKIILLTLVRSNADAKIGFLSIDNRVNVALSRAKEGMFIIGNMENFIQGHNVWSKINQVLLEHNQIGPHLTLRCQVHQEKETKVRCAEDFMQVPEGGCTNVCGAFLTCGHFCSSICHVTDREHINYVCQAACNKILCELQHQCPDVCSEECKPCKVQVFANLPCGHDAWIPCAENTPEYKCQTLVSVTLDCGHDVQKHCFRDVHFVRCTHPCEIRRPCGHACEEYCHVNDDPDHQIKKCNKECARINKDCSLGIHKCLKKCSDDCAPCSARVRKKRSCGHMYDVLCSSDVETVVCVKPCKKKLLCLHPCKAKCNEICSTCKVMVEKTVDDCGHKMKIQCRLEPRRSGCKGVCPRLLPCGHPCGKRCNEECSTKCKNWVDIKDPVACGHKFRIPCYLRERKLRPDSQKLLQYCTHPCNAVLKCSHSCKGTCGQCVQGRIHTSCKDKCGRTLVCAHVCDIPCNETCPPCNKPCSYRCNHSKCGKTCGEPCTSCTEKCSRQCAHVKCSKLCGEQCDVDACHEPCPKLLKCKHPCLGFCGDPCPPVCRICSPDDETFEVYFGNEDEPNVRFVHLLECKHNIEAGAMDHWMLMSDDQNAKPREIELKKCPKCTTVITKTQRYAQIIKNAYADVMKVKFHGFGEIITNNRNRLALLRRVDTQLALNKDLIRKYEFLEIPLNNINKILETQFLGRRNPIHKILINACTVKIQLMERILNICRLGAAIALNENALILLKFLFRKIDIEQSISRQFICDLEKEINRFEHALQLCLIENSHYFTETHPRPDVRILYDQLVHAIFVSTEIYTDALEHQVKLKILDLTDLVDKSMVLIKAERTMIANAINLGKGKWFACPNGHFYCIGDCGGAMQIARCIECKAEIGGQNHTLLSTNRLAGEIDGATRPAWSNDPLADMRNYQIPD